MRFVVLTLALVCGSSVLAQDFVDVRLVAEPSGTCLSVVGQFVADGASVI